MKIKTLRNIIINFIILIFWLEHNCEFKKRTNTFDLYILANVNSHQFYHVHSNKCTLYNQERYTSSYEPLVSFIYSVLYMYVLYIYTFSS